MESKYLIWTIIRMPFLVWQLLKLLISQIYEVETNTDDERSFILCASGILT